jgi:hypothetical protein
LDYFQDENEYFEDDYSYWVVFIFVSFYYLRCWNKKKDKVKH